MVFIVIVFNYDVKEYRFGGFYLPISGRMNKGKAGLNRGARELEVGVSEGCWRIADR